VADLGQNGKLQELINLSPELFRERSSSYVLNRDSERISQAGKKSNKSALYDLKEYSQDLIS